MKALSKAWSFVEEGLAALFFLSGIALIFYGVVMRYIFNDPQAWVEELSRYTIIWGTFFGFGMALKHNQHIQVDILYDRLSQSGRRVIDLAANLLSIIFCLFYLYFGYILVRDKFVSGMISLDIGIPMWLVYLILPLSGLLLLARFVERLARVLSRKEENYANPLT